MHDNSKVTEKKHYKSPKGKLIKFFENSRNKWKNKCRDSKYKIKLLKNRNCYLKKRKDELNKKVKQLEKQLGQYEQKKTSGINQSVCG